MSISKCILVTTRGPHKAWRLVPALPPSPALSPTRRSVMPDPCSAPCASMMLSSGAIARTGASRWTLVRVQSWWRGRGRQGLREAEADTKADQADLVYGKELKMLPPTPLSALQLHPNHPPPSAPYFTPPFAC